MDPNRLEQLKRLRTLTHLCVTFGRPGLLMARRVTTHLYSARRPDGIWTANPIERAAWLIREHWKQIDLGEPVGELVPLGDALEEETEHLLWNLAKKTPRRDLRDGEN